MKLQKHIGRISNIGTRIAVVYRQIPDEKDHCLVVELDRLPDVYKDYMRSLLAGDAADRNVNLFEVLHAHTFPDGSNCLAGLAANKLLKKVSIKNVVLTPTTEQSLPLEILNAQLGDLVDPSKAPVEQTTISEIDKVMLDNSAESKKQLAKNLMAESRELERMAAEKKAQAELLDPSLVQAKGRPPVSDEQKQKSRDKRNERRRERYAESTRNQE